MYCICDTPREESREVCIGHKINTGNVIALSGHAKGEIKGRGC
jgi:hypothetical protein